MNNNYQVLSHQLLAPGATLLQSQNPGSRTITLQDGAVEVFTDFRYARPFSIGSRATIDEVNDKMIACGVRLLFVADGDGVLQGLVTYTDIFGEKPVRYIQEHGGARGEILAQDIMTPLAKLEALSLDDVRKARVGDIVETIRHGGRQHMLVSLIGDTGSQLICGLFSSTQIEKQLGMKIELSDRAHTFADIHGAVSKAEA